MSSQMARNTPRFFTPNRFARQDPSGATQKRDQNIVYRKTVSRKTVHCFGVLLMSVGFAALAQSSLAQNTGLVMDSPPGDYIGQGQNYYYTPVDGTFTATKYASNTVEIRFSGPGHNWTLDFAAPGNALLAPGTYNGVRHSEPALQLRNEN
jgi:hypothetical protein